MDMDAIAQARNDAEKLKSTAQRLEAQLASVNEDLEKLEIFIEVAEKYSSGQGFSPTPSRKRPAGKTQKEIIETAAHSILRDKGHPMETGDMVIVIEESGISITGSNKNNTLASVLSRSDGFENIRGTGWHLKEWLSQKNDCNEDEGGADSSDDEERSKDDEPQSFQTSGPAGNGRGSSHDAFGFGS